MTISEMDPLRQAVAIRIVRAVTELTGRLPAKELRDLAASRSDFAALFRALQVPDVRKTLLDEDRLAPARLRGFATQERLLEAEGGCLPVTLAARHLRISRQAVDKRLKAGKLLALKAGRRGYLYPAWQFAQGGVIPGLEVVLAELKGRSGWAQMGFFLNGNYRLGGRTPLDELRKGKVELVLRAARAFGEHGAA